MTQVWDMDHQTYLKVMDSPHWLFVNSPKMFETDFLDMFSHNKWPSIFFIPAVFVAYYWLKIDWTDYNIFKLIPFLLLGIFAFSLTEYLIHRFIFHS